ncbi:MAG TPA: hypothetical protein VE135_23095 [Pyrinomonadaceae bacterium]|nr:hypothetical protein [Pyrinomonadaceae bacterium]
MKEKHTIDILEKAPFAELSESDRAAIETHSKECAQCRQAFEAAYLSAILLKEHAAETFAPSPFFETRVLARLRERQTADEGWAFGRMWRAAGALVSSMAATVALLAVLSFAAPGGETSSNSTVVSTANGYSAEAVMLNETEPADEQASDGQVLTTLYAADEEVAK